MSLPHSLTANLLRLLLVMLVLGAFSTAGARGPQAPPGTQPGASGAQAAASKTSTDAGTKTSSETEKKASTDTAKTPPPMTIIEVFANDPYRKNEELEAGIGNTIRVRVTNLKEAIEAGKTDPGKLLLYLNDLELKGVTAAPKDIPHGELEFKLERKDDSKAAWDTLLGSPSSSYKKVTVSVGPAGGPTILPEDSSSPPVMNLRVYYTGWFRFSSVAFLLMLAVFCWRAIKGNIIRDANPPAPPKGKRKPYSLARVQMAVWFFLVMGSFVFIYLITGDYKGSITEQALILMGIGIGTALGAAAIDANKRTFADTELNTLLPQRSKLDAQITESKSAQSALEKKIAASTPGTPDDVKALADLKVDLAEKEAQLVELNKRIDTAKSGMTKPVSEGFFNDLLTDANGTSFHRFQMLTWTIVLAFIFCVGVYQRLAMPEFSTTLLALMGISSGTYLGFKIPERQS